MGQDEIRNLEEITDSLQRKVDELESQNNGLIEEVGELRLRVKELEGALSSVYDIVNRVI